MDDVEAGPSSPSAASQTLTFKKRSRAGGQSSRRLMRPAASILDDDTNQPSIAAGNALSERQDENDDAATSVQDLIALRALTKKPTGIDLDRLNKGDRKKRNIKKGQEDNRDSTENGKDGLVSKTEPDSDEEEASGARRQVRKNNFQGETGTVDVDKHMMAYIEDEMRKRRGGNEANLGTDAEIRAAVNNPEDELYQVAEKYKALQRSIKPELSQEEREGNVALSAAMLSSIPEVDLGMDSRLKNIEETEKAKRSFYEKRRQGTDAAARENDEAFAAARFMRPKHHTMSDVDAMQASRRSQSHTSRHEQTANSNVGQQRTERRQMATDQLVLDRFKKRQKNFK